MLMSSADARRRARARDRSGTTSIRRRGCDRRRAAAARGSARRYCRPSRPRGPPARRICAISAVVVDLPLEPVIATKRRARRARRALAAEQFDVADDLDARRLRQRHRPMRLGMGQRHAGRQHEERRSSTSRPWRDRPSAKPAAARVLARRFVVVPGRRPPRRRRRARAAVERPEPPRPNSATLACRRSVRPAIMLTSASAWRGRPSRARRRRSRSA